jgi:AraC-like DNA-binding protein
MSKHERHILSDGRLPFILHDYRSQQGEGAAYSNWHENLELLYFLEGRAVVTSNDLHIDVAAGDIAVINANHIHALTAITPIRYIVLIVDRSFCLANHFDTNAVRFRPLLQDGEIAALFDRLTEEYGDEESAHRIPLIRARVLTILALLLSRYREEEGGSAYSSNLLASIKRALGYIHAEYRRPLTLGGLAATAGISKYYLAREFRRLTGMTVVGYLNSLRCEKAKPLLSEGSDSIEEVARAVGFSGATYFARVFKECVGSLPSEYRAAARQMRA